MYLIKKKERYAGGWLNFFFSFLIVFFVRVFFFKYQIQCAVGIVSI